jgi:hypothetical protein
LVIEYISICIHHHPKITARNILDRFGNASACAAAVNEVPQLRPAGCQLLTAMLVNNWRFRGRIPQTWYAAVLVAAERRGIDLTARDLVDHVHASAKPEDMAPAA